MLSPRKDESLMKTEDDLLFNNLNESFHEVTFTTRAELLFNAASTHTYQNIRQKNTYRK